MDRKFHSRLTGELESDSMTSLVGELQRKHPLSNRLGGLKAISQLETPRPNLKKDHL